MTRKTPILRIALVAAFSALVLVLVPVALAGHGGGGGAGPSSKCTRNAPGVSVDNNWAWGAPGSWGLAGQQLTYSIRVTNYDIGCASSSFALSISEPSGFSVSIPTSTITVKSSSSAYLTAFVTSPSPITDGDYPLTVTAQRAGTSNSTGSYTSYYKVYSSDTAAPTLFFPNPGNGQTISGNSYNVVVSSSDDHEVRRIDLYLDNVYTSTSLCDDVTYTCHLSYSWSLRGVQGQHTATFRSYDWLGNIGELTVTFTVS